MSEKNYRVRLNPNQGAEIFAVSVGGRSRTFHKHRGWYAVTEDEARALAKHRENALNPHKSKKVFEITTTEEAQRLEAIARAVEEPAGTPDKPVDFDGGSDDFEVKMASELAPGPAVNSHGGDITTEELTGKESAKSKPAAAKHEPAPSRPIAGAPARVGAKKTAKKKVASSGE